MASFDEAKLTSTLRGSFSTYNPTSGANKNADSTPTALVYKLSDGTTLAAAVTVTNITTGVYRFSVGVTTANGFAAGEYYELWVTAAVSGDTTVTQSAPIINFKATTNDVDVLSTLTQTQVTGGAYAIDNASFAFNAGLDFTTTQKAATLARVTLNDTTTTNTDMRGTDNASLAATALSTTQWTNTLATNIGTTNTTVAANLDTTVSGRMATYTQPTGFLAATFPATVASTTNITAASGITVSSIGADVVNASALAADAVAEIQSGLATPTNITAATGITVSSIEANVVTASALAADAVTEIQSGLATAATALSTAQWTNTLATNIGTTNTTVAANLDATVSSRLASASYTAPSNLTAAQIATGVWQDATAGDFTTASSVGKSLYNAFTAGTSVFTVAALVNAPSGGGGGDPWATVEPGSYIAGTFGYLLSTQIADKTDMIGNASAITSLLAAAVLEPGTITSFPGTLTIGDSYTTANGRSIQIPIVDTDGTPISVTGTLYFADATATFTIKRNGETDTSRTISGTATFTDPPGTGTGDEAPYATIELLPSETIKGLIGYKYSGVLTFTWTGTGSDEDEVMSFETDTILFDN